MGYNSNYRLSIVTEPDIALLKWRDKWFAPGGGYSLGAPVWVEVFDNVETSKTSLGIYPTVITNRRHDSRAGFLYEVSFDPTGLSEDVVKRLSKGWMITTRQLTPIIERTNPEVVKGVIKEICDTYRDAKYVLDDNGQPNESGRWDTTELIEFSKRYPDLLFKLEVEGRDNEDLWHLYVNNGKSQKCKAKIKYPKFKLAKLS